LKFRNLKILADENVSPKAVSFLRQRGMNVFETVILRKMSIYEKRIVAMMNTTVEKDIHEQLTRLPIERQRQVLEFARALAIVKVHGVHGQGLLHFAGTIYHEDLTSIEQAIKEGCEKVNPDEW